MKYLALKTCAGLRYSFSEGKEYDMPPNDELKQFVKEGILKEIGAKPKAKPKPKAAAKPKAKPKAKSSD